MLFRSLLFIINNIINYFLSPLIGRAILRFGERKLLTLEYGSLILVFLAYALVDNRFLVAILYILDHIFFNFSIAIRTFFQRIGAPEDISASMAVGFTINHIAAVFLPAGLGLLWVVSPAAVFGLAAAMAGTSFALAMMVPRDPAPGIETVFAGLLGAPAE